jgi:putative transposase
MIAFIDEHRARHGVEPICRVLPIAPSTYHAHAARRADPSKLPARAQRDVTLRTEIRRVYEENFRVYGVRKVWRQLLREGTAVARCTVARLMRTMGLQGVVRGKRVRTTISNAAAPCPLDRVNRQFKAPRPNALWVSDFTYVATWVGFVYVAFVIDTFARRIPRVGLCPPEDRLWLACLPHGARRLRAGRAGASLARAPARPGQRPRPPQ